MRSDYFGNLQEEKEGFAGSVQQNLAVRQRTPELSPVYTDLIEYWIYTGFMLNLY